MNTTKENQKNQKTYMSLSKISYGYKLNPKWAVNKWLSEPTTLEFIQLWESLNNYDFNKDSFIELCTDALSVGSSPGVNEIVDKTKAKSMFVDKSFDGDVFLHKDLALDFASWASPAFRTFCLINLQEKCNSMQLSFNQEEDFIISPKTLAEYSKAKALKLYKLQTQTEGINKSKDCYDYYYNS